MFYDRVDSRAGPSTGIRGRSLLILMLNALLVAFLVCVSVGAASAGSISPTSSISVHSSSGTTLAVARTGGAGLYDDAGQSILELPAGAALRVDGRTPDNRWFHGVTRDGKAGWASAEALLIFGVSNVPVREGFSEPTPAAPPAATSAAPPEATSGVASSDASAPLQATVASGTARLNVRAGPGTGYPVLTTVGSGAALTAVARNTAGDWVRVEQATLPGGSGWVSAGYLTLQGDAGVLPVAAAPARPAAAQPAAKSAAAAGLTGKLVFQERSGGRIYVYDLASGAQRVLTIGADPALSPDGRTVAFWREDGGEQGLYLIGIDGTNERRIFTSGKPLRAPDWSPDGSKLVFSHVNGEHRCRDVGYGICLPDIFPYNLMFPLKTTDKWGLARVDRDGGSFQDLAVMANALTPDWAEPGIFYGGVGLQVTQDVSDESQNRDVLGEYRYQDPAVQPGGDRIVFHSLEKDHWEIFSAIIDPAATHSVGSHVTALTRPATTLYTPLPHNVAPAWSPDGQHIVFLSNRTGQWKFWVMNPDGSDQKQLPINVPIEYNYQAEQVVSWGK